MQDNTDYLKQNKIELKEMYDREAEELRSNFDKFYKTEVGSLSKFRPAGRYFYSKKISEMIRLSNIKKGNHILEIGCKDGLVTFILANMGYRVTAVDLSPNCIKLAQTIAEAKGIKNAYFLIADAENLNPFPDDSFDAVISFSTLRYVPDPQKALKEIYRVLKTNCAAVVDFPNRYCPWFRLIKPLVKISPHIHDHTYSPRQVNEMFINSGFKGVKMKLLLYIYKGLPTPVFFIFRIIGEILERIPFINRTAAIIMCSGVKK